jgi:glycosyltransferase involved in cell wall biosynthesis
MHIGVVVLTHNEELVIEKCLNSILSQKSVSYTLFVSDNHSSDKTPTLLNRLISKGVIVRYERGEVKSPYQHFVNASREFLEIGSEIGWWIVVGADDCWESPDFLSELVWSFSSKKFRNRHVEAIGILPKVKIVDNRFHTFSFASSIPYWLPSTLRRYYLFLMPRSSQPLCFYFCLFNRKAFDLLRLRENQIESARIKFRPQNERSPEFETFYSLLFAGNVRFLPSRNAVYVRNIFNRSRGEHAVSTHFAKPRLMDLFKKKFSALKSSFYIFSYLRSWGLTIGRRAYFDYVFLAPLQVAIDFWSVVVAAIKRRC